MKGRPGFAILAAALILCQQQRVAAAQPRGSSNAKAEVHERDDHAAAGIDAPTRSKVIAGVVDALNGYVFPNLVKPLQQTVRKREQGGEYAALNSGSAFAEKLTSDLRAVAHDKHLRVTYTADAVPAGSDGFADLLMSRGLDPEGANHGFRKVERLDGDIGLLVIDAFFDPKGAGETVAAAMTFLADMQALIIDLRGSMGGMPEMVQLLCSYLFDSKPVHLNDIYLRPEDRTEQYWTLAEVPGRRFVGKPVYVLTSASTPSAAEEFAYDLKALRRATIVGAVTVGAANPAGPVRIDAHFTVWVPNGRAINPITHSNWEGVGVKPDVQIAPERALATAHAMALRSLIAKEQKPRRMKLLKAALDRVSAELRSAQ